MKTLDTHFNKNGLQYQLVKRSELVALYKLLVNNEIVGWEVVRIFIRGEHIFNGRTIQASEVLPSNEMFGREGKNTRSQAFHSNNQEKAEKYYTELADRLRNANLPYTYRKSDTFTYK